MSKKEFISLLETTLISANLDVTKLTLENRNVVKITFQGGGTRNVNIEADSYGAIILDVMKHVF